MTTHQTDAILRRWVNLKNSDTILGLLDNLSIFLQSCSSLNPLGSKYLPSAPQRIYKGFSLAAKNTSHIKCLMWVHVYISRQ